MSCVIDIKLQLVDIWLIYFIMQFSISMYQWFIDDYISKVDICRIWFRRHIFIIQYQSLSNALKYFITTCSFRIQIVQKFLFFTVSFENLLRHWRHCSYPQLVYIFMSTVNNSVFSLFERQSRHVFMCVIARKYFSFHSCPSFDDKSMSFCDT